VIIFSVRTDNLTIIIRGGRVMSFFVASIIGIIMLVIQAKHNKMKEKRIDDAIAWIMNPERRLRELSKKDRDFGIRRTDDEIVIDLQPDGFFESDNEHDEVEEEIDQ